MPSLDWVGPKVVEGHHNEMTFHLLYNPAFFAFSKGLYPFTPRPVAPAINVGVFTLKGEVFRGEIVKEVRGINK